MLNINTKFTPFRLRLSTREPVQLYVELANRDSEAKTITMMIDLGKQLSFDKGGIKMSQTVKIDELEGNGNKHFYFDVYAKSFVELQEHPVRIKVWEHFADRKDYVKKEYVKNFTLLVEK